jgi:hypothetical protein
MPANSIVSTARSCLEFPQLETARLFNWIFFPLSVGLSGLSPKVLVLHGSFYF